MLDACNANNVLLLILILLLVGWMIVGWLQRWGRCKVCGSIGELHKGACTECLGELVGGLRAELKEIVQ